jgi:uncharacterized phage-associated protein
MAFNVRKAAQVIALLAREAGGSIDLITAVKMAYLADRRFMELRDLPILNDDLVSMEHGPVDSETYNYIKGDGAHRDIWTKYVVTAKQTNLVQVARELGDDDFDELSDAEVSVIKDIFNRFKGLKPFQIVDYVHMNCPEWENVGKTSKFLPYERVFNALGKKNANALTDRVYEFRNLAAAHAQAK